MRKLCPYPELRLELRQSGKLSKEEMEKMIVDDFPSLWRLACQVIVRGEDILVEY